MFGPQLKVLFGEFMESLAGEDLWRKYAWGVGLEGL